MLKILLTAINSKYIHSNLAVYSLKAYHDMRSEEKNTVEIAEYTINQHFDEILKSIYLKKPQVIAFSCYIWNIEYVYRLAAELKKLLPQTDIWLGGPEVSFHAKKVLQEHQFIQGVMIGEGEQTFYELCRQYENVFGGQAERPDFAQIRQICFRQQENGIEHIMTTPCRELLDMDSLPFVYQDMTVFQNKIIYYESSRGCPFGCSYCLSSVERSVRFRSLPLVFRELQIVLDAKVPQVKFVDRTFNCNHERTRKLLKFIREHDNGITNFHFEVAADLLNEEELQELAAMREGLVQLEIGVQSTNPDTIKEIDRTMNLGRLKDVVRHVNAAQNVHQHLDLIAGLPFEDMKRFQKSFDEVYALKPEQLQLGFLKVLKGSKMYRKAQDYGIAYTDRPPYEVLYTKWLTYDEILELKAVEDMVENYYNSRQYVYSLEYLLEFFDTPYAMFAYLAKYYEEKELFAVKHSRISRYTQFYECAVKKIREVEKENAKEKIQNFTQLLTFDLYLRENLKTRPFFAEDTESLKDDMRMLYHECNAPKTAHLERVTKELLQRVRITGTITVSADLKGDWILFDYENRNKLDNSAKVYRIVNFQGKSS